AEDGIRDFHVTGVQTCALPIYGFVFICQFHVATRHHNFSRFKGFWYGISSKTCASAPRKTRDKITWKSTSKNIGAYANNRSCIRSEERRVGKECRSLWSTHH